MIWAVDEPVNKMSDRDQVANIATKYDEIVGLKYCTNEYGILTFVQSIIAPAYNDEWYTMQKDYLDGFGTEEGMNCQEWPVSSELTPHDHIKNIFVYYTVGNRVT